MIFFYQIVVIVDNLADNYDIITDRNSNLTLFHFSRYFWMPSSFFRIMYVEIKLLFHILLNKISIWNLRLL